MYSGVNSVNVASKSRLESKPKIWYQIFDSHTHKLEMYNIDMILIHNIDSFFLYMKYYRNIYIGTVDTKCNFRETDEEY